MTMYLRNNRLYGTKKKEEEDLPTYLQRGHLKKETESLFRAAPNNAERTNDVKAKIYNTLVNSKCRLFSNGDKTVTS